MEHIGRRRPLYSAGNRSLRLDWPPRLDLPTETRLGSRAQSEKTALKPPALHDTRAFIPEFQAIYMQATPK